MFYAYFSHALRIFGRSENELEIPLGVFDFFVRAGVFLFKLPLHRPPTRLHEDQDREHEWEQTHHLEPTWLQERIVARSAAYYLQRAKQI